MELERPYRHELKYVISRAEARVLRSRLELCMDRDEHAGRSGEYHIRSLYFDDMFSSAMSTKLEGVAERRKYRIRIYNLNDEPIMLECKTKSNQYIQKSSLQIDRQTCESVIAGDPSPLLRYGSPLGNDLYLRMVTERLRPVVIVDYVREAFRADIEDLRVTFDKNLRSAVWATDLFDKALPTVKALDDYDMILEIKFNRHLPLYYRDLLQTGGPGTHMAASKYCLCRKFEYSLTEG